MSKAPEHLNQYTLDPQSLALQFVPGAPQNEIDKVRTCVADWNKDVGMAQRKLKSEFARSIEHILPAGMTRDSVPLEVGTLLDRYAMADTLAIFVQRQLRRVSRIVLLLACGGLLCFELAHWFSHMHNEWAVKLLMSGFFLAWAVAIYLEHKAHRGRVQERYQDYRTLAEGLRVQFYWLWAGSKQKVTEAYPKRQRDDLFWLRFALSQWIPTIESAGADAKTVLTAWVMNQHDYFLGHDGKSGEVTKNRRLNDLCWTAGRFALYAGILLGGLTACVVWSGPYLHWDEVASNLGSVLLLLSGVGIVTAATCYAWRERFAYAEHVKNYSAMARIYEEAKFRIEAGKDSASAILVDLGHEAVSESTEWLMLHRERQATEARL